MNSKFCIYVVLVLFGSSITLATELGEELVLKFTCNSSSCDQKSDNTLATIRKNPDFNTMNLIGIPGYCESCTISKLNQMYRTSPTCQAKDTSNINKTSTSMNNTQVVMNCNCTITPDLQAIYNTLVQLIEEYGTTADPCPTTFGIANNFNYINPSAIFQCSTKIPLTLPSTSLKKATSMQSFLVLSIQSASMLTASDGNNKFQIHNYNIESFNLSTANTEPQLNSLIQCLNGFNIFNYALILGLQLSDLCVHAQAMFQNLTCPY